ncbi:NAD(P)/FAD-dependent oxidoreductase [Nocardiopsis dassonvillei]|uniref:NAD(P)-binding domain-containing protein n=1 Tax=Nocardiopsis dassonvillei TaxID=2014 RepID=UPI00200FE633|nr:NAD(P)/FAD-dependent oxidoreductase [Nocardiopsis dassonvillei]MCK9870994.1 NAD(P)/FAD-dependent oxidoreductase [Nocardiopsis dassonvillei]
MEHTERVETVVIGGGHAGLAMSHVLQSEGREHVVLEKARVLEQWRSARWDSFRINSPVAYSRMTGQTDGLPDGTRGVPLREMVRVWDEYVARGGFPVRERTRVHSVERTPEGRFTVAVRGGGGPRRYDALNVVAAPGNHQVPRVPGFADRLGPEVQQLRVGTYTNPARVRDGAVLVVGGGQTGMQLSEELARAGRRVYLATSRVAGSPRDHRGEDVMFWLDRIGALAAPREECGHPRNRSDPMPIVGHDHPISHHSLARMGVRLLGRLSGVSEDGATATFGDDLHANIAFARRGYERLVDRIEDWIGALDPAERSRYPPPTPEPEWEPHPPLLASAPPLRLSLREHGVRAVLWATGWRTDMSWLRVDEVRRSLGPGGVPDGCETDVEGFYWLGFDGLRTCASGTVAGFHSDASHIAALLRRGADRAARRVAAAAPSSEDPLRR